MPGYKGMNDIIEERERYHSVGVSVVIVAFISINVLF